MEDYRLKIKSPPKIKEEVERHRAQGEKIVFTNGCFDIIHPGHTRYLYAARLLGDYLVAAVNSDRSVKAIKGPTRPIQAEDERTEILAALSFVDGVFLFDEENPLKMIEYLLPDVLVKGGDWPEDKIVGADVVKKAGGRVIRIPFVDGYSTTDIIQKIRNREIP